jgi:hypothetical protein
MKKLQAKPLLGLTPSGKTEVLACVKAMGRHWGRLQTLVELLELCGECHRDQLPAGTVGSAGAMMSDELAQAQACLSRLEKLYGAHS